MYNFLCSDSLLYTCISFFFFLLYIVFIHVIVHVYTCGHAKIKHYLIPFPRTITSFALQKSILQYNRCKNNNKKKSKKNRSVFPI